MVNESLNNFETSFSQGDTKEILKLAKQSHENYLIKSTEKDLENAVQYYLEAIRRDPSIPEAHYKLASLLWDKGKIDIDNALERCERAVLLAPKCATARLYLGYFLRTSGNLKQSEQEFKTSIRLNPLFSAKPRLALASTIFEEMRMSSLSLIGVLEGIYYFFSGIIMILWDFNALKMIYKSFEEDVSTLSYRIKGALCKKFKNYSSAVKVYENAAEKTGKADMFYSEIGDVSVETGDYSHAVQYYRNAIKSSPDNIMLWAKLANILQTYCQDDVKDIIFCYNNMAELQPQNPRIFYELGHLYMKMDDSLNAVNAFKKAISLEKDNAFYHNSLAYALVGLEDFDGAISEYHKAIKLNPDNEWTSIVSQALGALYHQIKENSQAAIVSYQTASILDPLNVDAFVALGEAYYDNGDLSNAIDSYCEAIKLDPAIAKVYSNLGLALWEKDLIDEAVIAYQKAISLKPDYASAYNNLGVVYIDGAGKPDDALKMFREAININPNYALAHFNVGRVYEVKGEKTEAAKHYQNSININKFTNELDEDEVQKRIFDLFSV